jgi:hypothetical protein
MISIETANAFPADVPDSAQGPDPNSTKERTEMKSTMKQRNPQSQSSLAGVCSFILMLCAGQACLGQQGGPAQPAAVHNVIAGTAAAATSSTEEPATLQPPAAQAATQEKEAAAPAKPGNEGIKVHGHWTIDVKNPDGTLAQHHEFENSLQLEGAATIIQLITGIAVPSDMAIGATSPAGQTPPCGPSAQSICLMVRSLNDEPGGDFCASRAVCSVGLTSVTNLASQPYTLTYAGSFQAEEAGSITGVQSILGTCNLAPAISPDTTSPASCTAATGFPPAGSAYGFAYFTATTINAVAVSAGQIVQVSVAFTFS